MRRWGRRLWDRFNAGRKHQAWYYRGLLSVFERRLPDSRNLPEFRRLVGDQFRDETGSRGASA